MFRPAVLTSDNGVVKLSGQLKKGYHYALLPSRLGVCKYAIEVHSGSLRLNHSVYNPDGGTWSCRPSGQQAHYDLQHGQNYEIILTVAESYGNKDKIEVVNKSMMREAEFSYALCAL